MVNREQMMDVVCRVDAGIYGQGHIELLEHSVAGNRRGKSSRRKSQPFGPKAGIVLKVFFVALELPAGPSFINTIQTLCNASSVPKKVRTHLWSPCSVFQARYCAPLGMYCAAGTWKPILGAEISESEVRHHYAKSFVYLAELGCLG